MTNRPQKISLIAEHSNAGDDDPIIKNDDDNVINVLYARRNVKLLHRKWIRICTLK